MNESERVEFAMPFRRKGNIQFVFITGSPTPITLPKHLTSFKLKHSLVYFIYKYCILYVKLSKHFKRLI